MGYLPTGGGGGGVAIGDTITSATAGSVFFAGAAGVMAQDNAGFFYDDANNQLKLTASAATQTPFRIDLASAHSVNAVEIYRSGAGTPSIVLRDIGSGGNIVFNTSGGAGDTGIGHGGTNFGNGAQLGWNSSIYAYGGGNDTGLARTAAGIVKITNGSTGAGALHMQEMTAPSAPSANNVYIYAEDNGSGKTRLMALFGSGVAQQLAIEP